MNKKSLHRGLAALAASALLMTDSQGAFAAEPVTYRFDIAAQDLGAALRAFGQVSKQQIIFDEENVRGKRSPKLEGALSITDALQRLLDGTGLRAERSGLGVIMIEKASVPGRAIGSRITLSLHDMTASADETADDASMKKSTAQKKTGQSSDVEEMVVEGARDKGVPFSTANLDLTRTKDDALPFTVFTARDIELSGATNLQEFLINKLPQNFNEVIPTEVSSLTSTLGTAAQTNQVSMRGWNAAETVFLLNGRRMAPQFMGFNNDANNASPNLQGIPLRSIERIEILSSAGSAIYGANATGGIINIITRNDFRGGQFSVNYSTPADVHAPTRGAEASYAVPLGWQTNMRLTASFNESQPLQVGDRSALTVERWRNLVMQRDPVRLISRTATPPVGAKPNIRTVATDANANLFGAGTTNFATVPDGYAGGGNLSAFIPGTYSLELADNGGSADATSKSGYLGTATTNMVFGLNLDKRFSQNWRLSMDYSYSQNNFDLEGSSATAFLNVPAAAPVNPFGRDIYVRFSDPNFIRPELRGEISNVTWNLAATLRGQIGTWHTFLDVGYSHNGNSNHSGSFIEPRGGWPAAFLAGRYNPLVDARVVAPAAASFYEDYTARFYDFVSSGGQYLSALKGSGPLFRLPAGEVQLTSGVEWVRMKREDSFYFHRAIEVTTGNQVPSLGFQLFRPPGNRFGYDTHSLYAEISAPLLANLPLVNRLELSASGRVDRRVVYGVRSEAVNNYVDNLEDQYRGTPFVDATQSNVYALGLRYDVAEGMALRASQSIGFKPPTISQLTPPLPPATTATQTFTDPRRLNGTTPSTVVLNYTQFITGGNANLLPETTNSTNIGFIFAPPRLPGLRLSIDYLESVRDDVITSLSAQQAVNLEADLPGRVTRGAPDGHPSGVGPVTFLDLRQINFRQIASKSMDLNLEQRFRNVFGGQLALMLGATKNISFKVQTSVTTPPVEQIRSLTSTFSQQIAWNGNGQVYWEGKQWGMGWSARYYDYILTALGDRLLQGSDRAPRTVNHDAFVSYRTGSVENARDWRHFWSDTSVTFGIKNLFDREPRFWAANTDRGVAPYDSIMGRSIWLQMRKDFK